MALDLFHPLAAPFRLEGRGGEAVLLLHGFTGVPAHFRIIAPMLHELGYTISAPLLAGHGTSIEDLARTGRWDWFESAQRAFVELSDHRRVHIVGNSMGGLLAVLLAADEKVASLVTVSTPLRFRNRRIYLAWLTHRLVPRMEWPEAPPPDPEAAHYFLTYPGFPTRGAAELVRLSRAAYRAARRVMVPSLVIQSRSDETVDPRSADLLARALRAPVVWLENSRHNAFLGTERDRVHRTIIEHIS